MREKKWNKKWEEEEDQVWGLLLTQNLIIREWENGRKRGIDLFVWES